MNMKCPACGKDLDLPDSIKGPINCIFCGKSIPLAQAAAPQSKAAPGAPAPAKEAGKAPAGTAALRPRTGDGKPSPVEAVGVIEVSAKVPPGLLASVQKELQGEKTLLAFRCIGKGCLMGPEWFADEGVFVATPTRFVLGWRRSEGNQIKVTAIPWQGVRFRMELVNQMHELVRLRMLDSGNRGMGVFELQPADTGQLVRLKDFCLRGSLPCDAARTPAKGGSMAKLVLKNFVLPAVPALLWLLSYVLGEVAGVGALGFLHNLGANVNLPVSIVWFAVFVMLMWKPLFDRNYKRLFE